MPHITWMDDLKRTLPRAIRRSWDMHVFWPGEQVALDRHSPLLPADAGDRILASSDTISGDILTIRETFVGLDVVPGGAARAMPAVGGRGKWPELHVGYSLVGCAGIWPHAWFADPRPMRHIYGAIVAFDAPSGTAEGANRGANGGAKEGGRCLVPLLAGSAHLPDPGRLPVPLDPVLGRRAGAALKAVDTAQLPPMLGEFIVALTAEGGGVLHAALWHSPLTPIDRSMIQPAMEAAHLRHSHAASGTGIASMR